MDFALGPNQGAGVPAPYDSDGLLWDLASVNITFPNGKGFSGTLPGWGTGPLISAVSAEVLSSNTSSTTLVLSETSLQDITDKVDSSGQLSFKPSENISVGSEQIIFAYYLVHSRYREVLSSAEVPAAVPQSPVTNYSQNGSWVVDHFSAAGAQVFIDFWKKSLLSQDTDKLLSSVGNYLWEDSQEYQVYTLWTPRLQEVFQANRGYNINKYIPILVGSGSLQPNVTYITDEEDQGKSHVTDYQQTVRCSIPGLIVSIY